jgi:hypothetical protein
MGAILPLRKLAVPHIFWLVPRFGGMFTAKEQVLRTPGSHTAGGDVPDLVKLEPEARETRAMVPVMRLRHDPVQLPDRGGL